MGGRVRIRINFYDYIYGVFSLFLFTVGMSLFDSLIYWCRFMHGTNDGNMTTWSETGEAVFVASIQSTTACIWNYLRIDCMCVFHFEHSRGTITIVCVDVWLDWSVGIFSLLFRKLELMRNRIGSLYLKCLIISVKILLSRAWHLNDFLFRNSRINKFSIYERKYLKSCSLLSFYHKIVAIQFFRSPE